MKILLVRPRPDKETIGLQHVMIVEPLELEVLATLINHDDQAVIIDMILEKRPIEFFIRKEQPDLFCVTGYITNVPAMIAYCKTAKTINPAIVTIVGGVHCEVCPDDLNDESVDFRVVRNATVAFPQLLDFLRGEKYFPSGILRYSEQFLPSELPPFDFSFPIPDRKLTARYRQNYFYIFIKKVALIKTSFGCPFSCNFCFCRVITKGKYAERPLDEVVLELRLIKEKNIYIVDDDFLTSETRVREFIDANRKAGLQKNYLLYGRADFIASHPEIIRDFRSVGLKTVIVGIESFYDHELKSYHKNTDSKMNEKAMRILRSNNIDCYATIIVSPDWGKDDFDWCGRKIKELGIHYVNLQPFTPLPGTEKTVSEERMKIPYSDFAKWDLAHVTICPSKMSTADFYKSILKLYQKVLFQTRFMLGYLKKYDPVMLYKMIRGSYLVGRQYRLKIRETRYNA